MLKKITSVIIAIIILTVSTISFATSTQDLNTKKDELDKNISEAKDKITDIKEEVTSVTSELEKLNDEIYEKEDEIEELTEELTKLNKEIDELQKKLQEAEENYNAEYELFTKRMVAQYKMGKVSYLDVLLNSKSLTDFISKYYIIEKIAEYDNKLLSQIEEQKNEIENSKKEVEQKKSTLSEKQSKLKLEQITLSNKKANKNRYVSQLNSEEQELQKQIDKYTEEKRQIENELKRVAAQASSSSGANGYVYTGGKLTWPCPGYSRITSYFGYRGSAATGGVGSSNHKGIDLGASIGTSILAADTGVVIKVSNTCTHNYAKTYSTRCSCGGGFGNYLMISHGGGLVTLYAHCTSINVSVGQNVTAGEKIATVGTTGYSTGGHLHFSVLLNGTYVDPAPYLGM